MFRLSERVVISASSCTVLNSLKEHRLVRVMKSPHNMASLVLPARIELTTSPLPRGPHRSGNADVAAVSFKSTSRRVSKPCPSYHSFRTLDDSFGSLRTANVRHSFRP